MAQKRAIRVLLADDHNLVREGLRALLEQEPDMEVVASVADGREAVQLTRKLQPDVVVMDISMPGLNGIDATRQITTDHSTSRVVCLSVHAEHKMIDAMLQAGASAYLLKTSVSKELVIAVRTVANGGTYLSSPVAGDIVAHHVRNTSDARPTGAYADVTEREREVLQLIAEGHHTKNIAAQLCVSPKTVLSHRESLMRKLGVDSIAGLTRYALREGISEL